MRNFSTLFISCLLYVGSSFSQGHNTAAEPLLNYTKTVSVTEGLDFSKPIKNKSEVSAIISPIYHFSYKAETESSASILTSSTVIGLSLIDSHTEKDIMPVTDGMVISLSSLDNTKLNIRANTSPATVGSVKFELSGAMSKTYTDNAAPYALHGDNGVGNYYYGNWNPPALGTYTLKATPYSGSKATGTAGTPFTITFTITQDGTTTELYSLTVNTTGSGTVTKIPDQSSYKPGTSVTLSATPPTDYVFSGWSGSASGSTNPLSITMDGNKSITANFSAKPIDNTGGFLSVTRLGLNLTHANLGDQPQSKVWQYDGKWWAVFPATSKGTIIWRLDGSNWTEALKISTSSNTRADCKVVGNVVHFLLYRGNSLPSEFASVEYDTGMKTYRKWSARSTNVTLQLDPEVETATIDIDGTGRMWLASDASNSVSVRWSDHPYTTWSQPITVASNIAEDDISAVIAMPSLNKIGILWSDQNTQRFGFKTHIDGSSPTSWSDDEIPASQSAINSRDGMADDHLNMAIANDGTLYCAIKTGYKSGYPRIALLVRRPSGKWDNLYEVSQAGNRPIVILNEALGKVKVVYAAPGAGGIYYKESSTTTISFGTEHTLIDETCDYATSSKANYSSDIVIFASHNNYAYSVLATDAVSASSIDEALLEDDIIAYPNPFENSATINFSLKTRSEYQVTLFDMKGNQIGILKNGIAEADKLVSLEIDGSTLTVGLYIIKLQTPTKTLTMKLMLHR